MQAWGGPQTNSLLVNNAASLVRMSLFTIPDWRVGMTALEVAAWREVTAASIQAGHGDGAGGFRFCPRFWKTRPLAQNLHDAAA
eukprot:4350183-Pyramimonas_sp.AAC.1